MVVVAVAQGSFWGSCQGVARYVILHYNVVARFLGHHYTFARQFARMSWVVVRYMLGHHFLVARVSWVVASMLLVCHLWLLGSY